MSGIAEKHPGHLRGVPAIRTLAMLAEINPSGDIFDGWLMSQADLAVSNCAALTVRGRNAAISVDSRAFRRTPKVGDEVSLYAELLTVGRTSITTHSEAWRRCRDGLKTEKVTEATFTFVAFDDTGRSCPVA